MGFVTLLKKAILIFVLLTVIYIISFDKGDFSNKPAGAGQIWWADVPTVMEAYEKIKVR
ncbi:MAG: hypothetical protein SCK28_15050 [Bacillota bacterium]|nr:hypothetical protein [Bacillota bacterium]